MRFLTLLFFLFFNNSFSQEYVNDLIFNNSLKLSTAKSKNIQKKSSTLSLPFFDDFSYKYNYPNPNLWINNDAFINSTLCFNPINNGVATLDGLDSLGNPRDILNSNSHGVSDYLTSKHIDLSAYNEVYFSFFFQPQGLGNAPETIDLLKLQFKDENGVWSNSIWDTSGFSLTEFIKKVIVIDNSVFLHDEFQFRFSNEATLSGNFDHWHLDNILLTDDYNQVSDFEDISFVDDKIKFCKNYFSIPWIHFKGNQNFYLNQDLNISLRNNYLTTQSVDYRYDVYKNTSQVFHYPLSGPTRNDNIFSYEINGIYSYSNNANNAIAIYDSIFINDFNETAIFNIIHSIATDDSNFLKNNDTLKYEQKFLNYYSLDDGTAEASYGLNSSGAKFAMLFDNLQPDSLRSVLIHFEQNLNDVSNSPFQIVVWENNNGIPGNAIDTCSILFYPEYTNVKNGFYEYLLDEPIYINSSVFIGLQQINNDILNIGLDRNNINNDKMFYNIGQNWELSSCFGCEGSWMIRPVFGNLNYTNLSNSDSELINIYPNPTNSELNIYLNDLFSLEFYDISGKMLFNQNNLYKSFKLNTSNFNSGVYFIKIYSNKLVKTKKILVN